MADYYYKKQSSCTTPDGKEWFASGASETIRDYIKRDDAIRLLRGRAAAKYPASFSFGLFAAADEISKMPAADVAPVVHGRWSEPYKIYGFDIMGRDCSVCGRTYGEVKSNYCPNCGARMDGER